MQNITFIMKQDIVAVNVLRRMLKVRELKVTRFDSQGSVEPDLYIVRVGRLVADVSVYLPVCICETKTRFW